jgi:hypothetical protein
MAIAMERIQSPKTLVHNDGNDKRRGHFHVLQIFLKDMHWFNVSINKIKHVSQTKDLTK